MDSSRSRRPANGSNSDQAHRRGNSGAQGVLSSDERSRAELFEDEKRRIIESCFTKKEPDGAFAESYITHIPVWEDSSSPSSPPPADSAEENKKPRVIIVAVRRSGRVRLHKARENSNKSFSIGKTWLLDHLTAIESFAGGLANSVDEQQRRDWGGDTGMLITIQKPYFWKAASAKEKEFFVGSLVKIYRKYTGGKEPELTGFTQQQLLDLTPSSSQRPKTPQTAGSAPISRPSPISSPAAKNSAPYVPPPTDFQSVFPAADANGQLRPPSSGSASMRTMDSQDRIPPLPGQYPPDTPRSLRPQDSKPRFPSSRDGPHPASRDGLRPQSAPRDDRSRPQDPASSTESFISSRQEAQTPPIPIGPDRFRTNGAYSPLAKVETPPDFPVPGPRSPERAVSSSRKAGFGSSPSKQDALPERRRPPLLSPDANQVVSTYPLGSAYITPEEASNSVDRRTPVNGSVASPPPAFTPGQPQGGRPSDHSATQDDSHSFDSGKDIASALASLAGPDTPQSDEPESPAFPEIHRPGLGPMIKKKSTKDIANTFRKAAQTANAFKPAGSNAFKPRAGGAADRMRTEAAKQASGSDGINGVFTPAPVVVSKKDSFKSPEPAANIPEPQPVEPSKEQSQDAVPKAATPKPVESVIDRKGSGTPQIETPAQEKEEPTQPAPEERKKKRPSNHAAKYAKMLGIDLVVLEGRTADIEMELSDLGWNEDEKKRKVLSEDMQAEVRKELAKAETGTFLSGFENGDERVGAVGKMLDKAIAECDELDGLLMLYHAELGTLNEDVSYIEAQSQGLQVQTANQRLLYTELRKLLQTITISPTQLQAIQDIQLDDTEDVIAAELALSQLYKAMLTIDPKLRNRGRPTTADAQPSEEATKTTTGIGSEVSAMRAVQEKKDGYRSEAVDFILRLKNFMNAKFKALQGDMRTSSEKKLGIGLPTSDKKIDLTKRDAARALLWVYSPLMLFTREIDPFEWTTMLASYERTLRRFYQDESRETVVAWKREARKTNPEDQDLLFTTQEKESESLVGRKLTVKRSKTLREAPRTPSGEKAIDGKVFAYEVFAGALFDTAQSVFMEQNFISEMFHVSSMQNIEFPDLVASLSAEARTGVDLKFPRQFDPDRNLAKKLQNLMEDIFTSWPTEIQSLVDWVVSQDSVQGVGVLFALESKYTELEETNQEFIVNTLQGIHGRLATKFDRFVDEQIRGIEDTKVKIKKRKGVIAFVKTFPYFASTIENMLPSPRADAYEVRQMVNNVYNRINKAMFESLKFIAKESPVVMAGQKAQGQTGGDAEDKEILNYHILLIENMHHYVEEVDTRSNSVLAEWKAAANREMVEHTDLYLDAVVRRPLGKLLDSLESTESLLKAAEASGEAPTSVANKASHSRAIFKKLLSQYDAREIRHGIDSLKKRVDKHFGNADDPELSRKLVLKILRECEDRYLGVLDRAARLVREVYEGQGLEVEFKREDVVSAFRR